MAIDKAFYEELESSITTPEELHLVLFETEINSKVILEQLLECIYCLIANVNDCIKIVNEIGSGRISEESVRLLEEYETSSGDTLSEADRAIALTKQLLLVAYHKNLHRN